MSTRALSPKPPPIAPPPGNGQLPSPSYLVTLLGGWAVHRDGAPLRMPMAAQRLIAFLALNASTSRNYIAGSLWPDVSEERAHASLRSTIWRTTRVCDQILMSDGHMLGLSAGVFVDARELRGRFTSMVWTQPQDLAVDYWIRSSPDDLLPGWDFDWVLLERERLRQMRLHGLETIVSSLIRQGRYHAALQVALATVQSDPLRESAHREVIRLHLAMGHPAAALQQFRICANILWSTLRLPPSRQMVELIRRAVGGIDLG